MKRTFLSAALLSCALSLQADIRYVEAASIAQAPTVEVARVEDLQFLIDRHKIEVGYLLRDPENPSDVRLVVIGGGTHFSFDMKGHTSIGGYLAGTKGGFRDGADWREALELGLAQAAKPDSALYYFYKRNQFASMDDCKDAFKKGFAFLGESATEAEELDRLRARSEEAAAYYRASDAQLANYKEYQEFLPGLNQGLKTKADIQDARKRGFAEARGYEYYAAMEGGFSKYADYKAAADVGLESQADFARHGKIVAEVESIMRRQKLAEREAFIWFYLCQVPKGQQSLSVLVRTLEEIRRQQGEKLTKALDLYYSGIPSLDEWDKIRRNPGYGSTRQYRLRSLDGILSESSLTSFFKEVDTGRIGRYDEASGIFTRSGSDFIQIARKEAAPSPAERPAPALGGPGARFAQWVGSNISQQASIPVSQEYVGRREVLDWHTTLGQISTKTSDAIPASVMVEVVLGYKQADKAASAEITQRQIEIKDYLRRYFTELTVEDLRPRNEERRRIEIRDAINDDILKNSKIRDVRFLSLQLIEQ